MSEFILCHNFLLTGEKVSYEYKKPFDILAEGLSCTIDLGILYDLRTFIIQTAA